MLSREERYAAWLWLLLGLFCLRVGGQLVVALVPVSPLSPLSPLSPPSPPFLPPMEEWYSGLVPYGPLLVAQILIILLYGKVCLDFTRGRGYFVIPQRRLGIGLLVFGSLYLGAMVLRYVIRMSLYPDERWTGGSIPIFFHWILASFLLLVGQYHWSCTRNS